VSDTHDNAAEATEDIFEWMEHELANLSEARRDELKELVTGIIADAIRQTIRGLLE